MAKKSTNSATATSVRVKVKKKRPGVHSKTKCDVNKRSKHWVKPRRGQGK